MVQLQFIKYFSIKSKEDREKKIVFFIFSISRFGYVHFEKPFLKKQS